MSQIKQEGEAESNLEKMKSWELRLIFGASFSSGQSLVSNGASDSGGERRA